MKTGLRLGPLVLGIVLSTVLWTTAFSWQILTSAPVPSGTAALTAGPGGLWCGYTDGVGDTLMRVLNPLSGQVIRTMVQPERECRGLAYFDNSIWFLGSAALYRLNAQDGRVVERLETPYEWMRGLAGSPSGLWTITRNGDGLLCALFEPEGRELSRFHIPLQHVSDICWNNDSLWLTEPVQGTIHLFGARDEQEVNIFPTPTATPKGVAWMDGVLALIDAGREEGSNRLYRINPRGAGGPRLLPGTEFFDYGFVELNFTQSFNLPLYNIGDEDLEVDTLYLASGVTFALGQVQRSFTIAPGRFASIPFQVRVQFFGVVHDTLIIRSNDPIQPTTRVVLSALGVYPNRRLHLWPENVNFGRVRADPWRDGRRVVNLGLINAGIENLRVDSMRHHIPDIFVIDRPQFPQIIFTAETLFVPIWFEPHRGIEYIDTILIHTNQGFSAVEVILRGLGNDTVYAAGEILWSHQFGGGGAGSGAMVKGGDITDDGISEVYTVSPAGVVECLNGFASEEADVIWSQDFRGHPFRPVGVSPARSMAVTGDLDGDGSRDIIIGSGVEDRAVYAIDGRRGRLFWRWDSRWAQDAGAITDLNSAFDRNGDGAADPTVLIRAEDDGHSALVRLDGQTGRPAWIRNISPAATLADVGDMDRDGIVEFAVGADDGQLYIFNGFDGGLLAATELPDIAGMLILPDITGDGRRDLVCALSDGGLRAYAIPSGQPLWNLEQAGDFILGTVVRMLTTPDGGRLAFADEHGRLGLVESVNGDVAWVEGTARPIHSLTIIADLDGDDVADVLAGFDNGRVECRSGMDGAELWAFSGGDVGWRPALHLIPFDDADLGGTPDFIGLFGDRTVRCISTAGDLFAPETSPQPMPHSPVLLSTYPNPFNGRMVAAVWLPGAGSFEVELFDILGQRLTRSTLYAFAAGEQRILVDAADGDLPAGCYWLSITRDGDRVVRRVNLVK